MTDNTQNAPYQDFSQNDAPAAAPAQAAMPVAPSQTSAEKKKTFLHIAIGFIVGAALIAPTTWMIASSRTCKAVLAVRILRVECKVDLMGRITPGTLETQITLITRLRRIKHTITIIRNRILLIPIPIAKGL